MTDVNDHVSVSVGRARHVADNPINVADDVNVSKESGAPPGNDSPPPLAPDSNLAIEQAQDIFMNNTDVTSTGTDTAVKTFFVKLAGWVIDNVVVSRISLLRERTRAQ